MVLSRLPKGADFELKRAVDQAYRLREQGLCGVLIEDHSVCAMPWNDGHSHGPPVPAVPNITPGQDGVQE